MPEQTISQKAPRTTNTASATAAAVLAALVLPGCDGVPPPSATKVNFLGTQANVVRVSERVFSFGHDFTLSIDGTTVATVEQRILKLDPATTFTLKDATGGTLATARKKLLTLGTGTAIEVSDGQGRALGSIEKDVIESLLSVGSVYSIRNAQGTVVGKSDRLVATSTTFDLNTPEGKHALSIQRDLVNLVSDGWTITLSSDAIDARIIAFIPAFKTLADAKK